MRSKALLVLDFDGVICDSVEECFASSWTAYHELWQGAPPAAPGQDRRLAFAALRPFVRSGEDFVLIHEIVDRALPVGSQASFDAVSDEVGEARRARYRELFYQARTAFLDRDRGGWLALNRVYPHVAEALRRLPVDAAPFILSTKKPPFIAEILEANAVTLDASRIVWSDREPKLATVEKLRRAEDAPRALFVEDQIDAIVGNTNRRVRVYLATWGYVQEPWLREPAAVPLLTPGGFAELLAREFGS